MPYSVKHDHEIQVPETANELLRRRIGTEIKSLSGKIAFQVLPILRLLVLWREKSVCCEFQLNIT